MNTVSGSLGRIAAVLGLTLAFLAAGGGVATATAQEGEDGFSLGIVAVNCDIQAPEHISVQEEGCRPAEGVVFNATVEGFDVSSSCTAQVADVENPITAGCSIVIPGDGLTTIVSIDPTTVPDGYVTIEPEQRFIAPDDSASGEVGGLIFVNLLQDDAATNDDTSAADTETTTDGTASGGDTSASDAAGARTLPSTGAGVADAGTPGTMIGIVFTVMLAVVAGSGALALRMKNRMS